MAALMVLDLPSFNVQPKLLKIFERCDNTTRRLCYTDKLGPIMSFLNGNKFETHKHTSYLSKMMVDVVSSLRDFDTLYLISCRESNIHLLEYATKIGIQVHVFGFNLPRHFFYHAEVHELDGSYIHAAPARDVSTNVGSSLVPDQPQELAS